jgi:hypothetical protein
MRRIDSIADEMPICAGLPGRLAGDMHIRAPFG